MYEELFDIDCYKNIVVNDNILYIYAICSAFFIFFLKKMLDNEN